MQVLFLDFDGVLNSQGSFVWEGRRRQKDASIKTRVQETLCPVCCSNVQLVLDSYKDMKIVISSMWRLNYDIPWLQGKLAEYGIDHTRVIGATPWHSGIGHRGYEIQEWLEKHPEVNRYLVFDDNDDCISKLHKKNFIQTKWNVGFTFDHTLKAFKTMKGLKNEERLKRREEKRNAKNDTEPQGT